MITFNKTYSDLKSWCSIMPNAPYSNRYVQIKTEIPSPMIDSKKLIKLKGEL